VGKGPVFITETKDNPTVEQESIDWLRTGKMPKPRRVN
jgi:hypothetical protein